MTLCSRPSAWTPVVRVTSSDAAVLLYVDPNAVAEEKLLQRSFIDATDVEEVRPLVL
jgi:hypothetical protein